MTTTNPFCNDVNCSSLRHRFRDEVYRKLQDIEKAPDVAVKHKVVQLLEEIKTWQGAD